MLDETKATESANEELEKKVQVVLDKVRPALQADGGDLEYHGMEGNFAKVRLTGACYGCPMSTITLKMGIEAALKEEIPEIEGVIAV